MKANEFEQTHKDTLEAAEKAALKALQKIAETETVAATTDPVRIDAARAILAIRSNDA